MEIAIKVIDNNKIKSEEEEMAEFSMDKMARSVAEKVMEILKDNGVFDEDVVSRDAAKKLYCNTCFYKNICYRNEENCEKLNLFEKLPPAIPNQKTGKWIVDEAETNLYGLGTRIWSCHCPECGKDPQEEYIQGTENWWLSKLPNFCPHCGMKMEGFSNGKWHITRHFEAKNGKWIDDKCSVCGKGIEDLISSPEWYRNEEPNFCPFCGVKLEGESE